MEGESNHPYKKLPNNSHSCCLLFFSRKKKPKSIEDQVMDSITHASKIARALNVKITGAWQKYEKLILRAKERTRVGDLDQARALLRESHQIKKARLQQLDLLANINKMIRELENTHTYTTTAREMGNSTNVLSSIIKETTVEKIEELMDKWKESIEEAGLITQTLGEKMEEEDEEYIKEELKKLEQEFELELPSVPKKKTKIKKQALLN